MSAPLPMHNQKVLKGIRTESVTRRHTPRAHQPGPLRTLRGGKRADGRLAAPRANPGLAPWTRLFLQFCGCARTERTVFVTGPTAALWAKSALSQLTSSGEELTHGALRNRMFRPLGVTYPHSHVPCPEILPVWALPPPAIFQLNIPWSSGPQGGSKNRDKSCFRLLLS